MLFTDIETRKLLRIRVVHPLLLNASVKLAASMKNVTTLEELRRTRFAKDMLGRAGLEDFVMEVLVDGETCTYKCSRKANNSHGKCFLVVNPFSNSAYRNECGYPVVYMLFTCPPKQHNRDEEGYSITVRLTSRTDPTKVLVNVAAIPVHFRKAQNRSPRNSFVSIQLEEKISFLHIDIDNSLSPIQNFVETALTPMPIERNTPELSNNNRFDAELPSADKYTCTSGENITVLESPVNTPTTAFGYAKVSGPFGMNDKLEVYSFGNSGLEYCPITSITPEEHLIVRYSMSNEKPSHLVIFQNDHLVATVPIVPEEKS